MTCIRFFVFNFALFSAAPSVAEEVKLSSDVDFDVSGWEDDLGDKGLQSSTVISFAAVFDEMRFGLSTGYVGAHKSSDVAAQEGEIRTPLDTVISANWRGFKPVVAGQKIEFSVDADISLPSGKRTLSGRQKNVIFDPLLAKFDRYGEGVNNGLGVFAATKLSSSLTLGAGIKKTWTGKYRPDGDTPAVRIEPANTIAYIASANWIRGNSFLGVSVEFANEGISRRNGMNLLERGHSTQAVFSAMTSVANGLSLSVAATYSTRKKDKRLDEVTGIFEKELLKRDGTVKQVTASIQKRISPRFDLGMEADYISAGDSEIDDADFAYLPARRRWRGGPTMRFSMKTGPVLQASIKYLDYKDRGSALLIPLKANGFTAALSLKTKF